MPSTAGHQNPERVQEHEHELGQLDGGDISLEEQVLLELRSKRREAIVGVHDRMHARIEERKQAVVSSCVWAKGRGVSWKVEWEYLNDKFEFQLELETVWSQSN